MVNMASDAKNVGCEKANQAMNAAAKMAHRVYDSASEKAGMAVKFLT